MLNKNTLKRLQLVEMAMHGVVEVTLRRQNGTPFTFQATLLPTSRECATLNTEQYWKGQRAARLEKQKRRKSIEAGKSWLDKVDDSINYFYLVDAEEFRWRMVSLKSLLSFEFLRCPE